MNQIKYSIIIPTFNKLEQFLKPCVESLLKYTDFSDKELIIVSNGCQDGTYEWLQQQDYPFLKFYRDESALGYAKAVNRGFELSEGEYVILLNNDTLIQESPVDNWIKLLQEPFDKISSCGASGPIMNYQDRLKFYFLVFCCVMIKRTVYDEIGWLNEIDYNIGAGEDIEFCYKLIEKGYTLQLAPHNTPNYINAYNIQSNSFPLTHFAEGTVHDESLVQNWNETFSKNMEKFSDKFLNYKNQEVMIEVCTKNRYNTTLPITLQSLLSQTIKPKAILILDSSDNKIRVDEIPTIKYILDRYSESGIYWEVIFGDPNGGQHRLHQIAQEKAKQIGVPLVWRVDDDTVCEPNCLEELLSYMGPEVGAVGGSVITPPNETLTYNNILSQTATSINDILKKPNSQWFRYKGPAIEVDHLYCSFLYRVGINDYDLNLSPVAHREETLFSYGIKRNGKKVILNPKAITWHYRNPEGGIRTNDKQEFFKSDDIYFFNKLRNDYGIELMGDRKVFFVSNGVGDHFVFKRLIPELKQKFGSFIISCVFPEVFEGIDSDISVVSLQEGMVLNGKGNINYNEIPYNPYAYADLDDYNGVPVKNIEWYYRKVTGLINE